MLTDKNNKTCKAVYAVVAVPGSPFLNWAAASAYVAKNVSGLSSASLCTDQSTLDLAKATNHHILKVFDEIAVVADFKGTARERSRWVKTQVRSMVDGDLLFIDADAVPVGSLAEMFTHEKDFALTLAEAPFSAIASWYVPAAAKLAWKIDHHYHYTSGVFFLKDSARTREFGAAWNRKWMEWRTIDNSGVLADQPAFNSAVFETSLKTLTLPAKFNLFLNTASRGYQDARMFHYPASTRRTRFSLLETLSQQLAQTGECDLELVRRAHETGNPWTASTLLVRRDYMLSSARVFATSQLRRRLPHSYRSFFVR